MKTKDLIKSSEFEALSKLKDKTSKAKYSLIDITARLLISLHNASSKNKEALSYSDIIGIFWKEANISSIQDFLSYYSDKKVSLASLAGGAIASKFSKKKEEKFDKQTYDLLFDIFSTIVNENYRDFITYFDYSTLHKCISGIDEAYIAKLIYPDTKNPLPKWALTLQKQGINQQAIIAATPAIKEFFLSVISNGALLERCIHNSTVSSNTLLYKDALKLINTDATQQAFRKHINPTTLLHIYNNAQPLREVINSFFTQEEQITQDQLKNILQQVQTITNLMLDNLISIINIADQLSFDQDIIPQLQQVNILQKILDIIQDSKLLEKISLVSDDTILFLASSKFIQSKLTTMLRVDKQQLHEIIKLSIPDIKLILKILTTDKNLRDLVVKLIVEYSHTGIINKNIISQMLLQFSSAENKEICKSLKLDFVPLFFQSTTKEFNLPVPAADSKDILLDSIRVLQDDSAKPYIKKILSYDFQKHSPQKLLATSSEFQKDLILLATQKQITTLIARKYAHIIHAEASKDRNIELLSSYLQIEDKQVSTAIITNATKAVLKLASQPCFQNIGDNLRQMAMMSDFQADVATNLKNNDELRQLLFQMAASNDFRAIVDHLKSSEEISFILANEQVKKFVCNKIDTSSDTYDLFIQNGYRQLDSVSKLLANERVSNNISNIYKHYNPDMSVIDMLLCKDIRSSVIEILKQDDFYDFLYNSSNELISSISGLSDKDMKDNSSTKNTDEIKSIIDLLKDILQKSDKDKSSKTIDFLPKNLMLLKNKNLNFIQKICIVSKICSFCIKEFGIKKTINLLKAAIKTSKIKKSLSSFIKVKSNKVSTTFKNNGHKRHFKPAFSK